MLEIILDEERQMQAVKEVRWNGEVLEYVESVDFSFRAGGYPLVQVVMQMIPVQIHSTKMTAEVRFVKL